MFKLVNHIEATKGIQGKHLKFPITKNPKGPYKHHIMVRVDTGADVNCMNEKTFNGHFPEVQLSVCPHKIQNVRNSIADISILGQFHTYLEFRGEKYLNTFIVTNQMTAPTYSGMMLHLGWEYYFLIIQRRTSAKFQSEYRYIRWYIQHLPDPARSMTETKNHTVPI